MAIKRVPHKNGKCFIITGTETVKEWEEVLRTAGGCVGVTSVDYRADRLAQKSESEDPTPQE